jgi:hypothetical protein
MGLRARSPLRADHRRDPAPGKRSWPRPSATGARAQAVRPHQLRRAPAMIESELQARSWSFHRVKASRLIRSPTQACCSLADLVHQDGHPGLLLRARRAVPAHRRRNEIAVDIGPGRIQQRPAGDDRDAAFRDLYYRLKVDLHLPRCATVRISRLVGCSFGSSTSGPDGGITGSARGHRCPEGPPLAGNIRELATRSSAVCSVMTR